MLIRPDIHALVLAEGGVHAPLDGAMAAAWASEAATITVVTGAQAEEMAEAAERFAGREEELDETQETGARSRLRIVHALDHASGLSAVLRAGLRSLPEETGAAFVFLAGMPAAAPGITARLIEALNPAPGAAKPDAAAPVADERCGERRGLPVLVSRRLFPALMARPGEGEETARGMDQGMDRGMDRAVELDKVLDGALHALDGRLARVAAAAGSLHLKAGAAAR